MRHRLLFLLLAGTLAVPTGPLHAQDTLRAQDTVTVGDDGTGERTLLEFSLGEAVRVAREHNPAYLATRNDLGVAEWEVRSAYASLLPGASVSGSIGWQGEGEERIGSFGAGELGLGRQPSIYSSSYSAGVSLQIDGRALLEPGRARAGREATASRIRSADNQLVLDVTTAYLEVLRQFEAVRLAEQELERARFNLRIATGRAEVGAASALDVRQAEVQVGRSEVSLLQAGAALETARFRLLQQLGLDVERPVTLTTRFEVEEPDFEAEILFRRALEANPSLLQLRAEGEVSSQEVRMARSRYFPTLSLQAGLSGFTRQVSDVGPLLSRAQASANQSLAQCEAQNEIFSRLDPPLPPQDCSVFILTDDTRRAIVESNDVFPFDFTAQPPAASLTVSLPVFQGLQRQRDLEAAEVRRSDVQHRLRERELALQAEIASGLAQLRAAYRSVLLEERNVELADEQLRLARERYRLGASSFLDLVEAETVRAQAGRALLAAVYAYHDTLAALESVVGAPLRETGTTGTEDVS